MGPLTPAAATAAPAAAAAAAAEPTVDTAEPACPPPAHKQPQNEEPQQQQQQQQPLLQPRLTAGPPRFQPISSRSNGAPGSPPGGPRGAPRSPNWSPPRGPQGSPSGVPQDIVRGSPHVGAPLPRPAKGGPRRNSQRQATFSSIVAGKNVITLLKELQGEAGEGLGFRV